MKHENKMWLYGLVFTIKPVVSTQPNVAGINLVNVNQILKDSSRPISEKAESCKRFLQQCSSTPGVKVPDPQILLKMFEGEYLKPLGETSKSMSKCISSMLPFLANKSSEDNSVHNMTEIETDVQHSSSVNGNKSIKVFDTEEYINRRFDEMEQRLTDRLEKRIRELEIVQNQKLDTIIKLLDKK